MNTVRTSLILAAFLCAAILPGCSGDETTNNYYEIPDFVRITTDYLPDVQIGTAYSQTVSAVGGCGTFTWSIVAGGTNDSWLTIGATGGLTGTPAIAGQVIVTVRAEDAEDALKYDTERYVFYVTPLPVPSFPGTDVADNNTADDGMAFSPSTVDVALTGGGGMFMFTNQANGTGVFLAKMADEFDTSSATTFSLWASYFDGTEMTPMVEIRGTLQDPSEDFEFNQCRVIFVNMTGNARDGDAIILFARTEIDSSGPSDVRLYSAYFDVSQAGSAVSATNGDVHYGFDTVADLLNNDTDGEDADDVGFVTDGLYMMSVQFTSDFSFCLQGNPVTYVGAVWTESDASGSSLSSARFDLTAANTGNTFSTPVVHAPDFRAMDGNDGFVQGFHATGDCIVYRVEYTGETPGDNDTVVEAAKYNSASGGFDNTATLTRDDPSDDVAATGSMDVFGAAEGLGRVYVVTTETGYNESGAHADADLMLYVYNPSDGTSASGDIDYHQNNANYANIMNHRTALNRTGEVLFVGWIQQYQDAATGTDSFFMQAVQTIRTGGSARSMSNSILASDVVMNVTTSSGTDEADVRNLGFDKEVQYVIGNQSDHLRCNAVFLQEPNNSGDDLVLRASYLKVTLDTTGSAPPSTVTGSGSSDEESIWTNDTDFPFWSSINMKNFLCLDSGTGGAPIIYFVADGDGSPMDHTPGASVEPRLMYWDGPASGFGGEISGDCTATGVNTLGFTNSRQVFDPGNGAFTVASMPFAPYTGSNADVTAGYHNIIFMEQRDVPGSTSMIRHRCMNLAVQGQFFPPLASQPFDVSRDVPEGAIAMFGDGPSLQNNTTLAVYFKQGTHLWYNEYMPGSANTWVLDNGISDPYLVDDDEFLNDEVVTWNMMAIAPFTIGNFDLLSGLTTFYVKLVNLGGVSGMPGSGPVARMFCRIHD